MLPWAIQILLYWKEKAAKLKNFIIFFRKNLLNKPLKVKLTRNHQFIFKV